MILVLAEAPLMLVPKRFRKRRSVKAFRERFRVKYPVLDINYMPDVCRELGVSGRPDILHLSLLLALESPLARKGLLDVYFTTIEGKIFHIKRGTRLPRGYSRFLGLIGQTLAEGSPFIEEVTELPLKKPIILMDERGESKQVSYSDATVIVGAFSRGTFRKNYNEDFRISIYEEPLNTWDVVGRVIAFAELEKNILESAPAGI